MNKGREKGDRVFVDLFLEGPQGRWKLGKWRSRGTWTAPFQEQPDHMARIIEYRYIGQHL